jgi:Polysaccharide lyase
MQMPTVRWSNQNLFAAKLGFVVAAFASGCTAVTGAGGTSSAEHAPAKPASTSRVSSTSTSIPAGPNGVIGNTLCLNARSASSADVISHIEKVFGAGAVESPSDTVYEPVRPHVVEVADDGIVGPYFAILAIEPTDVNQDMVPITRGGDRSRTEIKIAPSNGGIHEKFKARDGDTFVYAWRFRIPPTMKFASSFTHIHQIKANGGSFADPPLITFTPLANGNMEIRHVGDMQKDSTTSTKLGAMSLIGMAGQWLEAREEITFSNTVGRYQLTIRDQSGTTKLNIDKSGLQLWRTGADHMRPKWGIYRKHDPALNQNVTDAIYFANLGVTRGSQPSANCRP